MARKLELDVNQFIFFTFYTIFLFFFHFFVLCQDGGWPCSQGKTSWKNRCYQCYLIRTGSFFQFPVFSFHLFNFFFVFFFWDLQCTNKHSGRDSNYIDKEIYIFLVHIIYPIDNVNTSTCTRSTIKKNYKKNTYIIYIGGSIILYWYILYG